MSRIAKETILAEAASLFQKAALTNRDVLLAVGQKLHDYVMMCLEEWHGLTCESRPAPIRKGTGFSLYSQALADAAEGLGTVTKEISLLLRTRAVVHLLGPPGDLPLTTLYKFHIFLRRGGIGHNDTNTILQATWQIKEGLESEARSMYARAVRENLSQPKVIKLIDDVKASLDKPLSRQGEYRHNAKIERLVQEASEPILARQIARASTGDAARMLIDLLKENEDPVATAKKLQSLLTRFLACNKAS
jgi:hypothetical protein